MYYSYKKTTIPFSFPATYNWFGSEDLESPILLLLHGYKQNAERIWRIAGKYIPSHFRVLATNAPFPIVDRKEDGSKFNVSFSWYFYDHPNNYFLIEREVAIEFIRGLWQALELSAPAVVVGYSQGGYISPLVGAALQAPKVIALASSVVEREDANKDDFEFHLIHGTQDEFVEHPGAKEKFEWYHQQNPKSHFTPLDTGHMLDEKFGLELKKVLAT